MIYPQVVLLAGVNICLFAANWSISYWVGLRHNQRVSQINPGFDYLAQSSQLTECFLQDLPLIAQSAR
jgi:hypothetical protein